MWSRRVDSTSSQMNTLQFDTSRRSVTPTREKANGSILHQRVALSPLRVPLEQAISSCIKDKSVHRKSVNSSNHSTLYNNYHTSVVNQRAYTQSKPHSKNQIHSQTQCFLQKHFPTFPQMLPLNSFLDGVIQQYEDLWGTQSQILDCFSQKVSQIFGPFGVNLQVLVSKTRDDGMIGLILSIFQQIKRDENSSLSAVQYNVSTPIYTLNTSSAFSQQSEPVGKLKNVLQQFMESMYQTMEKEIYNQFNVQMKRMVLKYRETERIIKRVEDKITAHVDVFQMEHQFRKYSALHYEETAALNAQISQIKQQNRLFKEEKEQLRRRTEELEKENAQLRDKESKMEKEIEKLKEKQDKLQNILIQKIEGKNWQMQGKENRENYNHESNYNYNESKYSRNNISTENSNANYNSGVQNIPYVRMQPFQIKIDTHIVQQETREHPIYSPIKNDRSISPIQERPSYQAYKPKIDFAYNRTPK